MNSILPAIPNFVFTVFEPISLIAGFASVINNPEWFVAEQIVGSAPEPLSRNNLVIALQLGNLYLLMAILGLGILYASTEHKVVRNYLVALWFGDIGHIVMTYWIVGHDKFVDVASWNSMFVGNVICTALLFTVRSSYFLGLFGPDREVVGKGKKTQ